MTNNDLQNIRQKTKDRAKQKQTQKKNNNKKHGDKSVQTSYISLVFPQTDLDFRF